MRTRVILFVVLLVPAAAVAELRPPPVPDPPGYTPKRTGDVGDFDYFAARWTKPPRRLKERGGGHGT